MIKSIDGQALGRQRMHKSLTCLLLLSALFVFSFSAADSFTSGSIRELAQYAYAVGGTIDATTCEPIFGGTDDGDFCALDNLSVGSGETVTITGDYGVLVFGTVDVETGGSIEVSSSSNVGGLLTNNLTNSGTVDVTVTADGEFGILTSGSVSNDGTIDITNTALTGIAVTILDGPFTNTGTINVTNSGTSGMDIVNVTSFINSGLIIVSVTGDDDNEGIYFDGPHFDNTGIIELSAFENSVALRILSLDSGVNNFTNSGTISVLTSEDIDHAALQNEQGIISNFGTISNSIEGVIINGHIINNKAGGIIDNLGILHNPGAINNECGGIINQDGILTGNPIVFDSCESTISINDVSFLEGNSGTTNVDFTVTRSGNTSTAFSVEFATSNGTATDSSDYSSSFGTLNFDIGEETKAITMLINGDNDVEADETFIVTLSNCTLCSITNNEGVATIVNDESAIANSILINEIELNPPDDSDGGDNNSTDGVMEQVELFNPTLAPIDVSNWNVQTLHGIQKTITIPENTVIPSNGFYLVGQDSQWLDNVNETVVLRNADDLFVNAEGPRSDELDDPQSWQRVPNGSDTWVFRQSTLNASNDISPPNIPPTADAGTDQQVDEDTLVTLNGTASSDSDGTIESYAWIQTAGPSVTLSNNTAAQPTFTAPSVLTDTTLTFSLVVTDDDGEPSVADTVDVLVQDVLVPNVPPTADAGTDQQVDEDTLVTLNGTASSDSDGTIESYAWIQTAGPSVTLSNNTAAQPTFTAPSVLTDTTLTFSLVVTDDDGEPSVADTVDVLVQDVIVPPSATIGGLIVDIESMNLENGVESSLIAPLKQAQTLLEDGNTQNDGAACGKLDAFSNIVNAKENNGQLTSDQAAELRQLAAQIEASLGC